MFILLTVPRPIKLLDHIVPFLAPLDISSAVLHILSAKKMEPGTSESTQSAVMVCNYLFVLYLQL